MNCPVCKSGTLTAIAEEGPRMLECRFCGGRFLSFHDYWAWLSALEAGQDAPLEDSAIVDAPPPSPETKFAKLCPECGHIMTRVRIDLETPFFLDRCGNCGGIWFDRGKWEALKSRRLHVEVHQINTASWQAKIKQAEIARANERMLRGRIGDGDYEEMLRVKAWLDAHPARDLIVAVLSRTHNALTPGAL